MNLLCLHGFLGSPSDFEFLQERFQCYCPDLKQLVHLEYSSLKKKILLDIPFEHFSIIGYSFGSRLGSRLFLDLPGAQNLYCLAGHLGLKDKEEIRRREQIEAQFLEKLTHLDEQQFLEYWNSLDLFKFDSPLKEINTNCAKEFFINYGLSKQPFLQERLIPFRDKIQFYYGEKDEKYNSYAKKSLTDFKVQFVPNKGHRLIQDEDMKNILLKELL